MSNEVMELLNQRAAAFTEFQAKNDEMLKAKADNKDFIALQDTVRQMTEHMQKLDGQILEAQKKANRPNLDGKEEDVAARRELQKAIKSFVDDGNQSALVGLHQKAANTNVGPEGGWLQIPEMDMVIDRVAPTVSAMYRLANVINIGGPKWSKMAKTSGLSMRRVADGQTGGETNEMQYKKVEIEVFPAEVEPWIFNELLEDSFIDLENDITVEAGIGFAEGAGAEFISGNGVGKSRGITAYTNVANASYAWGSIGYIASGATAGFAASNPGDKVVSLQHALKSQYRSGAVFLTNDATLGTMRQFKDGSGSYYLWNPDPAAGFGGRFLGSPVEIDDNMPDVAAGAYALAYGNFKRGYTIVNRTGVQLIRDNITAKGVTKLNFRKRFGGGITHFEAIKLMKFATS